MSHEMRLHPDDIREISNQVIEGLLSAKKDRQASKSHTEHSEEFEICWAVYPNRPNNNKINASKAFNQRVKEGVDTGHLYKRTQAYSMYCKATKRGGELILQASTFYGPSKRYDDTFTVEKEKAMLPRLNDELWDWAKKNNYPDPGKSESYSVYRRRLEGLIERS